MTKLSDLRPDWAILSGPTASRPAYPVKGQTFFNETLGIVEKWNGTAWVNANVAQPDKVAVHNVTGGSLALTDEQAQYLAFDFVGVLTSDMTITVPAGEANAHLYVVDNATSGPWTLTFGVSGGAAITVPQGARYIMYSSGTKMEGVTAAAGGGGGIVDPDYVHTDNNFTTAEKTKLANLFEGYVGYFVDDTALIAAFPTGTAGAHANVGSTNTIWAWDTGTTAWVNTLSGTLGDMLKSTYDPTSKNGDSFDMDNMVEGALTKIMTAAERTKLGGIAANATLNSADGTLLSRANHTGTQPMSTISDAGGAATLNVGTLAGTVAAGNHLHTGVYEPADGTILKDADIGVNVQGYDGTILKAVDIGSTVAAEVHNHAGVYEPADTTILKDSDIGVSIAAQGHNHTGVYEPADGTILKDADIGVTVQAYDATYVVDADIGVTVAAFSHSHTEDAKLVGAGQIISDTEFKDVSETVNIIGNTIATQPIDYTAGGVVSMTLAVATTTLSFTNPPATGKAGNLTLYITQDSTGTRLITWPVSVKWPGGTAPTLSTAVGAIDVITLTTLDGGTTWFGYVAGLGMA